MAINNFNEATAIASNSNVTDEAEFAVKFEEIGTYLIYTKLPSKFPKKPEAVF